MPAVADVIERGNAGDLGLANLIWTYVLPAPFHSDYAAPFFIVAVEIGLLAGVFGRLGFFRSRPNTPQRAARDRGDRRGR